MNKIITILTIALIFSLASFAQEKGKIGLRFGSGISNLYSKDYIFKPIFSYSIGVSILEKNAPFTVPFELTFETKGGMYNDDIQRKFNFKNVSIYVLPQYKFAKNYKHAVICGVYLSTLRGPMISPTLNDTISITHPPVYYVVFKTFDTGLCAAYKYTMYNTTIADFKIDMRFTYSFLSVSEGGGFRNLTLQTGLNIIFNNKKNIEK